MKKIAPLLLLPVFCLASCGDNSIAGNYKFLLGKQGEGETRVGINMHLDDAKYVVKDESRYKPEELELMENAKQFTIELDLGDMFKDVMKTLKIDKGMEGFYVVLDEKDPKYGNKMLIGFDASLIEGIDVEIPFDMIRNLIVSYIGGDKVTLQLPVSVEDLQYQLVWYSGQYFDFDPYVKTKIHDFEDLFNYLPDILASYKYYDLDTIKPLPGKTGDVRFGSHPVVTYDDDGKVIKDEIDEMNKLFAGYFSNTFVYSIDDDGNKGDIIGSIFEDEYNGVSIHSFCPLNNYVIPQTGLIDAYVVTQEGLFVSKEDVKVQMNVYNIPGIDEHDISSMVAKNSTVAYGEGDIVDIGALMRDPFEFRDFHDIKVQLAKE